MGALSRGAVHRAGPGVAARVAARLDWRHGWWPTTLAALVVRVAVVLTSPHYRPETDAADFNRLAVNLATTGSFGSSILTFHGGPTALRPPVFSALLSLVYRVAGIHWQAGRLVEACLGALAVALLWLIARRCFGTAVAHLAAGLAAIYPPLVMVGSSLLSESVFLPALLGTVLCGLVAADAAADPARGRAALGWSALCGVLLALTALSRSNGVVIGLPLLFLVWRGRPRRRPVAWRLPLALVLACAVALVPWTLRNDRVFGTPVPTTTETGYALAGIYSPVLAAHPEWHGFWILPVDAIVGVVRAHPTWNEAQIGARLTTEAEHYLEAHPGRLLYEAWWNLRRLLDLYGYEFEYVQGVLEGYPVSLIRASMIAFWVVGLGALAGAAVLLGDRRRARALRRAAGPEAPVGVGRAGPPGAAFWWIPASLFLTLLPIIGNSRYRSPVDPFLLLLTAVAVVRGSAAWRASKGAAAQPLASPRR